MPEGVVEVRVFRLGTQRFALPAKDVVEVVDWRSPTPLPGAPEAVLGIVAVQARMITVLDTSRLLSEQTVAENPAPGCVVVLTGQEQLGLTATAEETNQKTLHDYEAASERDVKPVLGYARADNERVQLLDSQQLFPAAIRGKERRQRER